MSGRPPTYKREYAAQAVKLCRLGATDAEIAEFFGVASRTVYRWQAQYQEFADALKLGKEHADERVERSLYHRAIGYTHEAIKIVVAAGKIQKVPYLEHVAPDVAAMIFWLKNRRPKNWVDRRNITVRTLGEMDDEDLEKLVNDYESEIGTGAPTNGTTH